MTRRANMKGLEMQSTVMILVRQRGCAPKTFNGMACAAPGYCWYYTDPSRTQGFWDACP
jgi:hypothetical protein